MRVTAETKQQTRERIKKSAHKLFCKQGFDVTSTRQIAEAAGIAAGTVFNYFPSKEALALELLTEPLDQAHEDFARLRRPQAPLEEDLFLQVSTSLRRLAAHRPYVGNVLETTLSPFAGDGTGPACELRTDHLQAVAELIAAHRGPAAPAPLSMHLYWTLFLGVLAFWVHDRSPNQEDTLVMLDQAVRLFVASLDEPKTVQEKSHGKLE